MKSIKLLGLYLRG